MLTATSFKRINAQGFNFALAWVKAPLVTSLILKSLLERALKKETSSRCIELLKMIMMVIKLLNVSFLSLVNTPFRPSFERLLYSVFSCSSVIFLDSNSR